MVIVKKLNPDELSEFKNLLDIFHEVFEVDSVKPADNYLAALLTDPNFMVFVVMVDPKVVAGLTVYVLHSYYTPKPVAYIYDVGVRPAFQGRGLGKQLLSEVCSYFAQNGFDHAYVEAEADDLEVVRFYRKTNSSTEMNVVHFTYLFPTKD